MYSIEVIQNRSIILNLERSLESSLVRWTGRTASPGIRNGRIGS